MIRLKRQRVAVATPDNRKTERTLAERGGGERENGRGQRVHRTASCLNERCCCGDFLLCGKSRCGGNTKSPLLAFIRTEEIAGITEAGAKRGTRIGVSEFRG